MKKWFEKDTVLKIISVFVAILAWLYVIYTEDPETELTIDDVPVVYYASEVSDNLEIIDYSVKTVDVTVKGSRSEVMKFEKEDLSAKLNISSLTEAGEYNDVRINISTSNKMVDIVEASEKNTKVLLDDIVSKKMKVNVSYDGKRAEGYKLSEESDGGFVTIKGAKTYIDEVKEAFVKINRKDFTESKSVDCEVMLKDKDGNIIDKKHSLYKHIKLSDAKISVNIAVFKTEMAKVVVTDGEDGVNYSVSPDKVEVYSQNKNIGKVYTESINGKTFDKDKTVTLKLQITDDFEVLSGETSVKVKIDS